jgi:hypothetical protein
MAQRALKAAHAMQATMSPIKCRYLLCNIYIDNCIYVLTIFGTHPSAPPHETTPPFSKVTSGVKNEKLPFHTGSLR